jgi:hypothetical protein
MEFNSKKALIGYHNVIDLIDMAIIEARNHNCSHEIIDDLMRVREHAHMKLRKGDSNAIQR